LSNNDLLTKGEFDSFRPHPIMIDRIERCRSAFGAPKKDFRIVDWGCGRGKLVLWLRESGYDAIGVDIDPKPFAKGAELFRSKGYRVEECLYGLDANGKAPFADSSFHFVTSWQTLEHVRDLDAVAAELGRLTMDRGGGFHVYPPHRRLLEEHLRMPFIHWLPKNSTRRCLIGLFVVLGIEPHWWPKKSVSRGRRIGTYYKYSVQETFYRAPEVVRGSLAARGFQTEFVDTEAWRRGRALAEKWLGLRPCSKLVLTWYMNYGVNLGLATSIHKQTTRSAVDGRLGGTESPRGLGLNEPGLP
jgi:hypothetical protein